MSTQNATRIRIGVNVPVTAGPGHDPVAWAREAERLGYDFVSASDHPAGTSPSHEVWTMLTWIAACTTRIGIATRVLGVPYRSPAMVAKMAETLSLLSGGRLILGLGGGYSDDEFRQFGLPVPSARDKVDGLAEAISILRGLWSEPAFTFTGRIHHTVAAEMEPKPSAPIPIWLGTFGPRALDVTGRLADGWIPSVGVADDGELPAMRERVRRAAERAGRDPDSVTRVLNVAVGLSHGRHEDVIAGSATHVADRLRRYADLGFTAFNLMPRPADLDQLRGLAENVLPRLRSAG